MEPPRSTSWAGNLRTLAAQAPQRPSRATAAMRRAARKGAAPPRSAGAQWPCALQ